MPAFKDRLGRRRVVVTGLGALTPLGLNPEEYWRGLVSGRSGIDTIGAFDASAYPTRMAGEVRGFEPRDYMDAKEARRMARFSQLAIAAAQQAINQACLTVDEKNADEVGVLLGTSIGSLIDIEKETRVLIQKGGMRMNPFLTTMMLPNMAAGQVSRFFGAKGYNSTVVTACAASGQALGEASEVIRRGAAQVMIAGGTDASVCELGLAAFCAMRALSTRNDDPTKASRPFDLHRDGFVAGEGAGVLILEDLEYALSRGAPIRAEIVGYGASADAYHVTAPDPEGDGPARAMRRALRDAGIQPHEVDYINAHATSTPLGDTAETLAIKKVFGDYAYRIPISAPKSMIGHLLGAAGAVEGMACVLTLRDQLIHPTINYEVPDPSCDLDCVPSAARPAQVRVVLNNSFGFGGQNTCLVFKGFGG